MRIPIYQIDAFARRPFEGNPAAVCPLDSWLDEELMQQIALENNLSETAFFIKNADGYHIRWFTPQCEIELCGHATLASAYVIREFLGDRAAVLTFHCQVGQLRVLHEADRLVLDFPARPAEPVPVDMAAAQAFGLNPTATARVGDKLLIEASDEAAVAGLKPDFTALRALPYRGFYVTSRGTACDFVCRMFAPAVGIDEDPVTGSAYTTLGPYWAERLQKRTLTARQISARGGDVYISLEDQRVLIGGHAVCVMQGELCL